MTRDHTNHFGPLRLPSALGTGLMLFLLHVTSAPCSAQPVPAMFRGGTSSLGEIRTRGVDRLGAVTWTFKTGGPVRSSPTVAEGVVYVGSSDGRLYAIEAHSGKEYWRCNLGSPLGGAPLVTETHVVVTSRDNRIVAVRRTNGEVLWEVQGGPDLPLPWGWEGWDYILGSVVLSGDMVLAGTGDGTLYAVDLNDGTVRWQFQTRGRIRSTPAILSGRVYIGSGDGIVYGISLENGQEAWRFETAGHSMNARDWGFDRTQIYSTPSILEDTLYIGSRDASLYAIQISTAETLWTFQDGTAWVISSPAVSQGTVFSARSSSGRIRALDAHSGAELWSTPTGGYVFSSPVLVGQMVYVGSGDGRIYSLDRSTGAVQWVYQTGGGIFSTPALWDGRLYIGSDDGVLYALETAEGPQPIMAVYWDSTFTDRSVWGRRAAHRRVRDYFESLGYNVLDSAGLSAFLSQRITDGTPSAVMVSMDVLPSNVTNSGEASLLRAYLSQGGKVIWMGLPPLVLARDSLGRITGVDRDRPSELLGIDHGAWNTDEYGVSITHEGRAWGLSTPWVGMPCVAPTEPVTILAVDELGRAASWAKTYGGGPGTGFVFVHMEYDATYLEELRRVVEYGILRFPSVTGQSDLR